MRRTTRIAAAAAAAAAIAGTSAVVPAAAGPAGAPETTPSATAEPAPLDRAALQRSIDAFTRAGAVGVTAYVSGPNGTWSSDSGEAQRYPRIPAVGGEKARVASNTKSMVATVALQEVEAGRWSLDTTIDDVLPGAVPGHGDVTLEQLLSHRSGMPDYLTGVFAGPELSDLLDAIGRPWTDAELLAVANALPWTFEPGTTYGYSNSNYLVVGMMLQRATGQSMKALLAQRVFGPAGMTQSSFATTPAMPGKHLVEYLTYDRVRAFDFEPSLFSSAGAVVAPMRDLDRFWDALMGGRLLEPATVDDMITPRTTDGIPYGLGTYALGDPCLATDGSRQLVHGHDGGAYGTTSMTFASRDGSRQVSIAWTGRDLTANPAVLPVDEFLVTALEATCTTGYADSPAPEVAPQDGGSGPAADAASSTAHAPAFRTPTTLG